MGLEAAGGLAYELISRLDRKVFKNFIFVRFLLTEKSRQRCSKCEYERDLI